MVTSPLQVEWVRKSEIYHQTTMLTAMAQDVKLCVRLGVVELHDNRMLSKLFGISKEEVIKQGLGGNIAVDADFRMVTDKPEKVGGSGNTEAGPTPYVSSLASCSPTLSNKGIFPQ